MDIKNLFHDRRQVGRTVKASKIYYVWEFVLSGKLYKLELFLSVFSGKKKFVVNGELIFEDDEYSTDFNHTMNAKGHTIKLIQKGHDNFDLEIDNRGFKLLLQDEVSQTYSIVKRDDNKAVDELCSGLYEDYSNVVQDKKRGSERREIPNFFDDNDFDFGDVKHNNVYYKQNVEKVEKKHVERLETNESKEAESDLFSGLNNNNTKNNNQNLNDNIQKQNSNQFSDDIFGNLGSSSNEKENNLNNNVSNNNSDFNFDFTGKVNSNTNLNQQNSGNGNLIMQNQSINQTNSIPMNNNSNNMFSPFNNYNQNQNTNIMNTNYNNMSNMNYNPNMQNQFYQNNQGMYGGVPQMPQMNINMGNNIYGGGNYYHYPNNINDLSFLNYNKPNK